MASIRLISDDLSIHYPNLDNTSLHKEQNYLFRAPAGKFSILCFSSHEDKLQRLHPFVEEAILADIGVVYVCESLPENHIIDPHIVYIECPYRWYIHTLFMNPLQFRAVFSDKESERLARAFSEFTHYNIPRLSNVDELRDLIRRSDEDKNNILLEITGGVGDHLMCIPTIKTLAAQGKRVSLLIEPHRVPCFNNLDYIYEIFTHRSKVDVSHYERIIILHFGQILNDYRSELNKQNRIYSVANLCGLNKGDLVINRPEIILSRDEIDSAKKKWSSYPQKLFFGFDSDRVDARIPESLAQDKINFFKSRGFTVFTASIRKYNLNNCIDLTKQVSIRELFALLAVMDYVVTIDTAFLHIAGALNKCTIALMNYFPGEWRCGTYENCIVVKPQVACCPCIAKQFVESSKWQCHNESCYSKFDWERIYNELRVRKSKLKAKLNKPENIQIKNIIDDSPLEFSDTQTVQIIHQKYPDRKQIAAFWMGGIGDAVMLRALCKSILRKHPNSQVTAFVRDKIQAQLFIFDAPDILVKVKDDGWAQTVKDNKSQFDLAYEFSRFPVIWQKTEPISELNSSLYSNWGEASKIILESKCHIAFYYADKLGLNLKWDDFKIHTPDLSNEVFNTSLKKYRLPSKYITVHHGSDNGSAFMKMWNLDYWKNLARKLSEAGYSIIQLGSESEAKITQTKFVHAESMLDLLVILKQSSLHVDNEGGLVHLANALGTKSVVLFGPTNPNTYGYPTNMNLYKDECPSCWWQGHNWSGKCLKGHRVCVNMEITPEDVFNKIQEFM